MSLETEVYEPCPCRLSFFRTQDPLYMLEYPSPAYIVTARYRITHEAITVHTEKSSPTAMSERTVDRLEEHFALRRC